MGNLNKVMVMGNLTKDPKVSGRDNKVTFITIAVNHGWNDKETGDRVEKATFIDCKAFGNLGVNIAKWFSKGRPIFIEGHLVEQPVNEDHLKSEAPRLKTMKVQIDSFEFCDKKRGDEAKATQSDTVSMQDDDSDFDTLLNEETVEIGAQG